MTVLLICGFVLSAVVWMVAWAKGVEEFSPNVAFLWFGVAMVGFIGMVASVGALSS